VRNQTQVPADLRELIILRVAVLNRAPYEFDAHVPHARVAGVGDAKLLAVCEAELSDVFAPRERLVLELTDAMTREVQVSDALMARVRAQFDARLTVEVVTTVAAYNMVSRLLVALNVGH
jgi:4-carboxymuconolactone decarboxylase